MKYIVRVKVLASRACARAARKGQTTVEYLLMLAVIVGMAMTFSVIFYKHMLKLFYIMVGMTIGAGTPS
ncbi:MAG: hypothetical protein A3J79_14585 [Elusimicrobia bacterium RIFOXYB2_FULL_62_6]|nr:MAG: hypothetical protein A3J79_14585 [Elusimicrobia bacterium RIFOXYB2_FULL_62_6]